MNSLSCTPAFHGWIAASSPRLERWTKSWLFVSALALSCISAPAEARPTQADGTVQRSAAQQAPIQRTAVYAYDRRIVSAALAHEALLPTTNSLMLPEVNGVWPALDVDSPLLRELQVRLGVALLEPMPLMVSGRKAHLDLLQARSGEATARGFVARTARGPTGTLLFSTPYANLDLSVVPGDVQVQVLWARDLLSWGASTPTAPR